MSWFVPWTEMLKNGSVRYILQRYLGQYFEEKLSVEQLTVDLFKGIGSVTNVVLDVQALNELGEQHNLPVEFVDGSITKITVRVPWSSILTESSSIQVDGLSLVIQPKQREDCATSMFESMWSSMTTSIQLAEECLKQSSESNSERPVNGVQEVAKTIDTVFARVKIDFYNTTIRLEHLPKDKCHGSAIKIHIKQFSYSDETSTESFEDMPTKPVSAYSVKIFSFDGLDFCSNEFYASDRTMCRSLLIESNIMNEQPSKISDTDSILFAKFLGKQEIRLKIKQKENVSGPKFDLEVNGSSLVSYFSPRQLRTVCEVLCGLMSPHLQDTSNMCNKSRIHAKPMTTSDYERVEHELNQHMNPSSLNNFVSKSLQNTAGWSSAGGLEDESDDDFHPIAGHASSSLTSSVSNSVTSSCHSTSSSYHLSGKANEQYSYPSQSGMHYQHGRSKEKGGTSEPDFSGEINSFQLRLNFLAVILLHQDILQTSNDFQIPEETSVDKMKSLSDKFFSQFTALFTSSGRNDFKSGRQILQNSVEKSHFRLYCTTLIANAEEKSNPSNSELHGAVTVANLELVECLFELKDRKQQIVELFSFTNASDCHDSSVYSQPVLVLHFKHLKNLKHYSIPNRLELTANLQKCESEFDITIIDRLCHVLENLDALLKTFDRRSDNSNRSILSDVHTPMVEMKVQWKMSSPLMVVKLRFPIPDLRTESDDDSFWCKRDIYNDVLFIELTEMSTQNRESSHQVARNFELQCKSVRIVFQEANCDKCVPILFSGIDEKYCQSLPNAGCGFDWPRVVLRLYPKVGYIELEEEEEERLDFNVAGPMFQSIIQTPKETSPFSSKIIMRESNTVHTKKTSSENDGEEIILPGTKEEIGEFIEGASRNALIQLNVTLPSITIQLPSKHLYEVIYNRFNNDLLLWTPKSWKQRSNAGQTANVGSDCNFGFNPSSSMFTSFSLCKSAIRNGCDSDDEDHCENLLLNTENCGENSAPKKYPQQQQSNVAISLFASQGVVDVLPHARDSSGKVIPGQFGEIQILFQEADLFLVSGCKSEPLLNYVCLQINHIGLYHSSLIPAGTEISLKSFDSYPSPHLMPTLYKTHEDAVINENAKPVGIGSANGDDMLTLAIRAQGQENRLKNICVANSLNGVTIRHRMKAPYTSWLSQLINFFDVVDYPILHYQPWKIITQLHQQFVNCVIDYRPLHLPLRAALTIENFNISSNITTKTSTSILRLIAEEGSLFLSKKVDTPNDVPQNLSLNLRKDYVCVIEVGLFELSLRLTDGAESPQTDLRASNNIVRIRTCADSAVALLDLVKYIASDGDLHEGLNSESTSNHAKNSDDKVLVTLDENEKDVTGDSSEFNFTHGSLDGSSLKKEVPELVEEAMNDMTDIAPPRKRSASKKSKPRERRNIEVFYFPDENTSRTMLVGEVLSESDTTDDDIEAEFCILEAEQGIGYLSNTKIPEVRLLTKEPIKMVDNHFTLPLGKEDVLKAPKNYPVPVSKYTLREMSIVWHMYGGSDFTSSEEKDTKEGKKQVTIPADSSSETSLHSLSSNLSRKSSIDVNNVSFIAGKFCEMPTVNFMVPRSSPHVNFSENLNEGSNVLYDKHQNSRWQAQGGPNRDHDSLMELKLTKVKYQYEMYPKTTKQASRQVLLVQEVEIRDRMATSQINKFLYQYSSSARPKQSNAYMVMIKATNIRPEQNISTLQECCLRVSLLPLRLNIDQDSLLFLIKFFSDIAGNSNSADTAATAKPSPSPVMNIEDIKVTESPALMVEVDNEKSPPISESTKSPVFIRSFVFSPEVPIRLDYEPKRVDLKRGPLAGLIMGLGQLNCSELKLKKIYHRYGLLGLEKLLSFILAEWLQDIKKNQLPSILGGVGPIYSLVQLFQGIRDLFWLPIEQYQKDGRIVRGLQRGANSFTTSSAMAVLEITARLVYAIQRIAETAFDIVSPGPSIKHVRPYDRSDRNKDRRSRRPKGNQPADIREGFHSALQLVKEGIGETAQTLVRVASVEHEVKGAIGAVGGVLREIPPTAIRPIIIASQATTNVLDGVRSQLMPDARAEAALKWRSDYF